MCSRCQKQRWGIGKVCACVFRRHFTWLTWHATQYASGCVKLCVCLSVCVCVSLLHVHMCVCASVAYSMCQCGWGGNATAAEQHLLDVGCKFDAAATYLHGAAGMHACRSLQLWRMQCTCTGYCSCTLYNGHVHRSAQCKCTLHV
jgi:hypothetical protein